MYALDFEYDGQRLSDYGFIICDFESKSGFVFEGAGSNLTFTKTPFRRGKRHGLANAKYEECIRSVFGICKNPDIFDDMSVTTDEYRDLIRWLNRSEFLRFSVIYEDTFYYEPCYYLGSFNVEKVKVRDILYGLKLTFESDKPFAYGMEQIKACEVTDISTVIKIRDLSDEIGYTYPKVNIKCNADGDLSIKNSLTGCNTTIRKCVKDEVIFLDCENHIIETSVPDHDVYDDFNYDYFCIGNSLDDRDNYISVSLPCAIEIKYTPIIKEAP